MLVTSIHIYGGMHIHGEKLRTEASSNEKSPLHKPLHCDHTFELMLIVYTCF